MMVFDLKQAAVVSISSPLLSTSLMATITRTHVGSWMLFLEIYLTQQPIGPCEEGLTTMQGITGGWYENKFR